MSQQARYPVPHKPRVESFSRQVKALKVIRAVTANCSAVAASRAAVTATVTTRGPTPRTPRNSPRFVPQRGSYA